jgi:hypothetical protein
MRKQEQSGGYILIAQKDDAKTLVAATPYVSESGALSLDLSGGGLTTVDDIKDLTDLQTLNLSDCSRDETDVRWLKSIKAMTIWALAPGTGITLSRPSKYVLLLAPASAELVRVRRFCVPSRAGIAG